MQHRPFSHQVGRSALRREPQEEKLARMQSHGTRKRAGNGTLELQRRTQPFRSQSSPSGAEIGKGKCVLRNWHPLLEPVIRATADEGVKAKHRALDNIIIVMDSTSIGEFLRSLPSLLSPSLLALAALSKASF